MLPRSPVVVSVAVVVRMLARVAVGRHKGLIRLRGRAPVSAVATPVRTPLHNPWQACKALPMPPAAAAAVGAVAPSGSCLIVVPSVAQCIHQLTRLTDHPPLPGTVLEGGRGATAGMFPAQQPRRSIKQAQGTPRV